MILPLSDTLMNCLQNLTSRIAGVDNEQMSNRVIGMGAMLGYSVGAIKEQFKTPESNIKSNSSNNDTNNSFLGRVKTIINPQISLSDSTDYNGNYNPIREVITKNSSSLEKTNNSTIINENNNISKLKNITSGIAKTGYNLTKSYFKFGVNLAEGNFNKNNSKPINSNKHQNNFKTTEYANTMSKFVHTDIEKDDENEPKTTK